jgi:hypothetical protein
VKRDAVKEPDEEEVEMEEPDRMKPEMWDHKNEHECEHEYEHECEHEYGSGRMVLAHAYVRWQRYDEAFSPQEALKKGTLFPNLYGVYPVPK